MPREIILAKSAGFCFGVKKAIDKAEELGETYIFGSLIHNPQEVERLRVAGKKNIHALEDLQGNQVVITAHGLDIKVLDRMKAQQLDIIDTTCPLVTKIYREGWKFQEQGYQVVIIGDPNHVEVKGIASRMQRPYIVYHEEDIERVPAGSRVGVVCQSTLLQEKWGRFIGMLQARCAEVVAVNTICKPTKDRQNSAEEVAQQVGVMIIIGGHNSSNTNKLKQVCEKYLKDAAFHVETAEELDPAWFQGKDKVGVTAGASTPDYLIQQVVDKIRSFDEIPVGA